VNRLVELRIKCRIVKLADLVREIKSTWAKGSENSEGDVIAFYSELPVLFIDEVGVQFGSDTEKLLISEIIDNRYQELLPTVLISNLDVQGIKGAIGDRCFDRLREDGGKVVAFDWESHRGKAA
jgi:DNA replication protein DnaC